jgi:hypothetical protein
MVPSENKNSGICRLLRPAILLMLLVLPLNAGTRLEGKDKVLNGKMAVQPEKIDRSGKKSIQRSEKKAERKPVTNHQISPWNKIQVF